MKYWTMIVAALRQSDGTGLVQCWSRVDLNIGAWFVQSWHMVNTVLEQCKLCNKPSKDWSMGGYCWPGQYLRCACHHCTVVCPIFKYCIRNYSYLFY